MLPYIIKLAKLMKYIAPLASPIVGMANAEFEEKHKLQLKLMEELANKLNDYKERSTEERKDKLDWRGKYEHAEGAELRALWELLDKVDPRHIWGGLKKILTPEGHYLWLCDRHAKKFKKVKIKIWFF